MLSFSPAAALVLYSAVAATIAAWRDSKNEQVQQKRSLQAKMVASRSYFEWSLNAAKLDALGGTNQEQRWQQETRLYDRRLLEEKVAHLRHVRTSGAGVAEQMFAVRADLMRNLGNITNSALHEHFPVVPGPIREYIEEVRLHMDQITTCPDLDVREKSAFLKETRHAFGRTALIISGGGPLATFHLGVVKALLEHRMLPRVLAGSSIGAVICALAATRTDEELTSLLDNLHNFDLSFFSTSTALQALTYNLLPGTASEADLITKRLRHLLGDLTFLDAYALTGRVLSVSVTAADSSEPPRLLNYLTSPHVVVWSAVACSAALPGLSGPQDLLARSATGELVCFAGDDGGTCARRWRGGAVEQDVPMRGLSEMFSVNHFIVSQTNLHVVPVLHLKRELGTLGTLAEAEFKHRCRQLAEVAPRWAPGVGAWLRRFSQPWEGDVTIVLPETLFQLRKTVIVPTHDELLQAVRQGELCTWSKLSAIQCNCGIESTLDACIQTVGLMERQEKERRRAAAMPLKNRLPSWADMASLGKAPMRPGYMSSSDSLPSMLVMSSNKPMHNDSAYFSTTEEHLPLPEERGMVSLSKPPARPAVRSKPKPTHGPSSKLLRDAAMECTDSSATAFALQGLGTPPLVTSPRGVPSPTSTRNSLDVIAP